MALLVGGVAWARTTVDFGRITAVNLVTERNKDAQTRGAILGGLLGAVATSSASAGTRAVGTVGGAVAGQRLGRLSGQRQLFEYTIEINHRQSLRMVTDEASLRVGDCVAVERGSFNNLRLVDDRRCATGGMPTAGAVNMASSCIRAKDQLLAAKTDDELDRAERRMRLLCVD